MEHGRRLFLRSLRSNGPATVVLCLPLIINYVVCQEWERAFEGISRRDWSHWEFMQTWFTSSLSDWTSGPLYFGPLTALTQGLGGPSPLW
jgi:hypothetical protein